MWRANSSWVFDTHNVRNLFNSNLTRFFFYLLLCMTTWGIFASLQTDATGCVYVIHVNMLIDSFFMRNVTMLRSRYLLGHCFRCTLPHSALISLVRDDNDVLQLPTVWTYERNQSSLSQPIAVVTHFFSCFSISLPLFLSILLSTCIFIMIAP